MSEIDLSIGSRCSGGQGERSPFGMGLAELMIWVLGAGIGALVCRQAKPWEWLRGSEVDRILDLLTAVLAIFFGIGLLRQTLMQQRRLGDGCAVRPALAAAWCLAVVVLLGAYLVVEAPLLRYDPTSVGPYDPPEARRRLLTFGATLVMAGILAGLSPGPVRAVRRLAWLSVLCAAVAGVSIVAYEAVIPYLVLGSIEGASNGMKRIDWAQRDFPGLRERIAHAGLTAIPALVCCLLLGVLIAHELRRSAGQAAATRRGSVALLLATAATAATAGWLLATAVPILDASLAEGLWATIAPADVAIIVIGFAGEALGLAARAADRPGASESGGEVRWTYRSFLRNLLKAAAVLVLLDVIISRVIALGGYVEWSWMHWTGWLDSALVWFWGQQWIQYMSDEWLVLGLTQAWVFWRVAWLWLTPIGAEPIPIDACLGDRAALGRFAARWVALTVLMVASLPVLFILGLAVLDGFYRALG